MCQQLVQHAHRSITLACQCLIDYHQNVLISYYVNHFSFGNWLMFIVPTPHVRQMKFKQVKTGFMKRFEGCWRVEPLFVDEKTCQPFMPKTFADYVECTGGKGRVGSRVSLEQIIQPALVPPPPISWYLRGITSKTTEMLINDLLAEAARIRGGSDSKSTTGELPKVESDEMDQILDIKKRWALRRKNAKQLRRRSPPLAKSPTCD